MKMFYYKGAVSNFGDDINPWLWNRLIPDLVADDNDGKIFLGIGSILFDNFPADQKKIVLGSGFGGYSAKPKIDENWKFYFVRGPRTAEQLGLSKSLAITDAAILLRSQDELLAPVTKRHRVGFMPHWESAMFGAWKAVCEQAGINYIDPRDEPYAVLQRLRETETLVTEAMHGAIIADTLRVPWIPILPTSKSHHFKWHDWCESMEVKYSPNYIGASTVNEFMRLKHLSNLYPGEVIKKITGRRGGGFDFLFRKMAARRLREIAEIAPTLSSDIVVESRTSAALEKVREMRADYHAGRI